MVRTTVSIFLLIFFLVSAPGYLYAGDQAPEQEKTVIQKSKEKAKEQINKHRKRAFNLDIPIAPFRRKSVHLGRIRDNNLLPGPALNPWSQNISMNPFMLPEAEYRSSVLNLYGGGGIFKANGEGGSRKNRQLELAGEGSRWKFLVGGQGFVEEEKISGVPRGLDFNSDFRRISYGLRAWTGFKTGDFNGNYFVIRYGHGYIKTGANDTYRPDKLAGFRARSVYEEDFSIKIIAAESRFETGRFSNIFKAEADIFDRKVESPDSDRSGFDRIEDIRLANTLEVLPFRRYRRIRLVFKIRKDFSDRSILLFRSDPSDFQLLLRIRLN